MNEEKKYTTKEIRTAVNKVIDCNCSLVNALINEIKRPKTTSFECEVEWACYETTTIVYPKEVWSHDMYWPELVGKKGKLIFEEDEQ